MKEADLPSPGPGSTSMHLRRMATKSINQLKVIENRYAGGVHPDAAQLKAFFDAAATAVAPLV